LAAIGAIMVFLGFIPVIGIIGVILVLIGLKGLSEHYNDNSIFSNAIWGVIFAVIGMIALAFGFTSIAITGIFSGSIIGAIGGLLLTIVLLVVVFIFLLFAAMYFRKAFYALAARSGEQLFHTAGTLMFIGAVLIIVFFVGLILFFIAWIIATIGFFSLRSTQQPSGYNPPPPPATSPTQSARFCPYCGAPVEANATFCSHCGKQLT